MGTSKTPSRRRTLRALAAAALIVAVAPALTGCLQALEADQIPAYTVVQYSRDFLEDRKFGYIDGQGEQHPMECPAVGIFTKRYCESEDGLVRFEYSVRKGSTKIRTVTVDGAERSVSKVSIPLEGIRYAWAPKDALSAGS